MRLACADVLPFRFDDYAVEILGYIEGVEKKLSDQHDSTMTLSDVKSAVEEWKNVASALHAAVDSSLDRDTAPQAINEGLMGMERCFIPSSGLPGRAWFRHLIYAPGPITGYAAQLLPGITGPLEDSTSPDSSRTASMRRETDILVTAVHNATEATKRLMKAANVR